MIEIDKMVNEYNKNNFPEDETGIEDFESDSPEVQAAVKKMGITLEEYQE